MGTMKEDRQSQFFNWLAKSVSSAQLSELYQAFTDLEYIISANRDLYSFPNDSLLKTTDANTVDKLYLKLAASKKFMHSSKSAVKLSLLNYYARYCKEVLSPGNVSPSEISNTDAIDPVIVKSNQQAFTRWLNDEGLDTVEVFSVFMAAREIHKMLLNAGTALGLFGYKDPVCVQACIESAIQREEFIKNDRLAGRLWTKAMDHYLRFIKSKYFMASPVDLEQSPSKLETTNTSVAAELPKEKQVTGQKLANNVMDEEGFRKWLVENKPNEQADLMMSTIRNVEQYAQKNNMRSIKFFGIKPSEAIACVNHMLVSRSFVLYSAGLYQNFKHAAMLLNEYKKVLASTTLDEADSQSKTEKKETGTADQLQKKEKDPDLEPSLMMLLQGEQLAVLRDALVTKGILTLERFKQINLWVFMNQNGLYSIGQRQTVYSSVRRALASDKSKKTGTNWKMTTLYREYHASSPAEALIEYCRAIAAKYPLRIRGLVGQRMSNTNTIPLFRTRMHGGDLRMDNPEAYVDGEMSDEVALAYARWISTMCRDNDLPQSITCVGNDKDTSRVIVNEDESAKHESETNLAADGMIASLVNDADYSYTKPVSARYKGSTIQTDSWQEVYRAVCRWLYFSNRAWMLQLVMIGSSSGTDYHLAGTNTKNRLKSPREFAPYCYFEGELTATEIMRCIRGLLSYFNVRDNFEIRYQLTTDVPLKPAIEKVPALYKPEDSDSGNVPDADKPDASALAKVPEVDEPEVHAYEEMPEVDQTEDISPLQKQIENLVLSADLNGLSLDQLQDQIPGITMRFVMT